MQPEVKISINSDKVLSVKDFEYSPASEYSPCSVSGLIEYDIAINPPNFTGLVSLKDAELQFGGKWKKKTEIAFAFIDGKQQYGTSIGHYPLAESSTEEKSAICASKSSSDIKLISLGKPLFALKGTKLGVEAKK